MPNFYSVRNLRKNQWSDVPDKPGTYSWYFPESCLVDLGILNHCNINNLLLKNNEGMLCLYHGYTSNLKQRVVWHSAQKLRQSNLKHGTLSTFRFTLLSLLELNYSDAEEALNNFMDSLEISWQAFDSKMEARQAETKELKGNYHYPLNIQENRKAELSDFIKYLKSSRKIYKKLNLL